MVHLTITDTPASENAPLARGWLDHVAFAATDIASVRRRLDAAAIAYDINEVPQSGDAQIFLRDPAGIGVELNFKT